MLNRTVSGVKNEPRSFLVHLTGGILRHFRAFPTLEQNPALGVLSRPAHPQVTQTVRRLKAEQRQTVKTLFFNRFMKITLAVMLVPILIGCGSVSPTANLIVPDDIPIEEFVIGRWLFEGDVYYENLGYRKVHTDYWFEEGNVFKVYSGDGTTCKYEFIDADEIAIDCRPRSLDPWTIKVERDGQFLLVHYSDGQTLKFKRIDPNEIHRDG